jgi:hypothetical protein
VSREEVGQHLYDLPRIRAWLDARDALAERHRAGDLPRYFKMLAPDVHQFWEDVAACFFAEHPRCYVVIRDEYGEQHP